MAENFKSQTEKGEVLKAILRRYVSKWHWFVIGLIITCSGAYLYLRYTPKVYLAKAKINVLDQNDGINLSGGRSGISLFGGSRVNLQKEIQVLKSQPILEKVVVNQDLMVKFFYEGNVQTTEVNNLPFDFSKTIDNKDIEPSSYRIEITKSGFNIYKNQSENPIRFPKHTTLGVKHNLPFELNINNKDISADLYATIYHIKLNTVSNAARSLGGRISVNPLVKGTELLNMSISGQNDWRNKRTLNELINVFNQDGIEDRTNKSLRTLKFIENRFESLSSELDSLETDIKEFKQQNKIVNIESGAEEGMSKLTATQEQLFGIENQLLRLSLIEQSLQTTASSPDLLPTGVEGGSVSALVSEYNKLVLESQKYETSAGKNNPQLMILKEKLRDLKSNIFASINILRKQLQATKSKLEEKNRNLSEEVYSIPAKQKMFLDIKRQQEIKQELYVFLLQKREEAAVSYAITQPTVKVIESARSGGVISPNANSIYTRAVMAGLGLPFALIYLISLLDNKLKDRSDIESVTRNIPIVGELPKNKEKDTSVFLSPNDNSSHAEAFRIMAFNLNYVLPKKNNNNNAQVIFVTSTIKGEGKTYVSLNLSLSLSSLNKKVLVIGGDLRNPQLHNHLGIDKNQEGLSNFLYDTDFDWRKSIVKAFDQHPNHNILLSGSIPPNPTGLLSNGRLEELFDEAKKEYDYIVMDNAPTILVSDTMINADKADVTIYVTRANFTEIKLINYANELSKTGKLNNMTFVINALDRKSNGYGYKYQYNYGYGYGYGADQKRKK